MAVVLGTLAFIMSLGALWLTSEALRRSDGLGEALVRPHLREVKSRLADNRATPHSIDVRLETIERQVKILMSANRAPAELVEQTQVMRDAVEDVRRFDPSSVYHA